MEIYGFDEFVDMLDLMGDATDEICAKAVYEGAGMLADAARQNLRARLSPEASGDLEASLGVTPIGKENGAINARVGFDGYDKNGVANALKANVLESGRSGQPPRPFMRPAIAQSRARVQKRMAEVVDEELNKLQKG